MKWGSNSIKFSHYTRIVLICILPTLCLVLFSSPHSIAQGKVSGDPFESEVFSIMVPSGWKTLKNPEGFYIGFVDWRTPSAKWYLNYQLMPKYVGGPPSDPAMLKEMAAQFDNLARQQFPDAKRLPADDLSLPGKTVLFHLLYEVNEYGTTFLRRYVFIHAHNTGYVIVSSIPKSRSADAKPGIDMLFRTFTPKPGASASPMSSDQAVMNLLVSVQNLAASMPVEWRATIKDIRFLQDTPKKGDISLLRVAKWPRRELGKEFASVKESFSMLRQGRNPTGTPDQAAIQLVNRIAQLFGGAVSQAGELKRAITGITISMVDSADNKVGTASISTKDFINCISGNNPERLPQVLRFE